MSEYTLNDIKFNPNPPTLCRIGEGKDTISESELREGYRKNREMMERLFREFEERKAAGNQII